MWTTLFEILLSPHWGVSYKAQPQELNPEKRDTKAEKIPGKIAYHVYQTKGFVFDITVITISQHFIQHIKINTIPRSCKVNGAIKAYYPLTTVWNIDITTYEP